VSTLAEVAAIAEENILNQGSTIMEEEKGENPIPAFLLS
jgi:hypothetical protein